MPALVRVCLVALGRLDIARRPTGRRPFSLVHTLLDVRGAGFVGPILGDGNEAAGAALERNGPARLSAFLTARGHARTP